MKIVYLGVWLGLAMLLGQTSAEAKIVIVPGKGARQEDARAAVDQAFAYLKRSPLARKIIGRLEHSPTEYKLQILNASQPAADTKPAEFDAEHDVIWWDAHAGLEWKPSAFSHEAHSAALVLMHELGHAYHRDCNPREYWREEKKRTRDNWGTAEEKRTILQVENPVAKALGEPRRDFHEDSGFYEARHFGTASPTTTRPSQVRKPLFEALF